MFYLMVLVVVLSITLSSTMQIIRPIQVEGVATSQERLMIEMTAQEHVARVKDYITSNSDQFLNTANYESEVCSNSSLPCYRQMTSAAFASAMVDGGTDHRTYTKSVILNNTTLNITSSLQVANLKRFNNFPQRNVFVIKVVTAASGATVDYEDRFSISPSWCEANPAFTTSSVNLTEFGNEDTTNFELFNVISQFVQVGQNTICWNPGPNTTGTYCFDDDGGGAAATVQMLDAYTTYMGDNTTVSSGCTDITDKIGTQCVQPGDEQYSLITLHNNAPSYCGGAAAVLIRVMGSPLSNTISDTETICPGVTLTNESISVARYAPPSFDDSGNYHHQTLVAWLDPTAESLDYITARTSLANGGGQDAPVSRTMLINVQATDKIAIHPETRDVVVTGQNSRLLYNFQITNPLTRYDSSSLPAVPLAATWTSSTTITEATTAVTEFGKPIFSRDGEFALVPALVDVGGAGTDALFVIALNLRNHKINSTNQPSLVGKNYAVLMRFSGVTGNTGGQITSFSNFKYYYNPVNNRFYWIAAPGGTHDQKLYEWDPNTWGNGSGAATTWVTSGQEINKLSNFTHRGYDPSAAAPANPEGYTGDYYTVRAYNSGDTFWGNTSGDVYMTYSGRDKQMVIRAPKTATKYQAIQIDIEDGTDTLVDNDIDGTIGRGVTINNNQSKFYTNESIGTTAAIKFFNPHHNYAIETPFSSGSLDTTNHPANGDGQTYYNSQFKTLYVFDMPTGAIGGGNRPRFFRQQPYCVYGESFSSDEDSNNTFTLNGTQMKQVNIDYALERGSNQ